MKSQAKRVPKGDGVFVGSPSRPVVPQIDDVTYKLLRASPEAVALRTRAIEWKEAADKDGLDHSPGCRHEREAERAHRRFMQAAYEYGLAVERRGREHMHLWARPGELVNFLPMTRDARNWIREHGWEGKAIMVRFWCEQLTVRSPVDRRRKRTFGPLEATWASIDSEAEKVRFERVCGLRRDPWSKT
jgi:hypothetical protein